MQCAASVGCTAGLQYLSSQGKPLERFSWQQCPMQTKEHAHHAADQYVRCTSHCKAALQVALLCQDDLTVQTGCPCASTACAGAAGSVDPACIAKISEVLCAESGWMEATYQVSARNLFTHVAQDCGAAAADTCQVRTALL